MLLLFGITIAVVIVVYIFPHCFSGIVVVQLYYICVTASVAAAAFLPNLLRYLFVLAFKSPTAPFPHPNRSGRPEGKVSLKWEVGIKAEVWSSRGAAEGIFRAVAKSQDRSVWTVGLLEGRGTGRVSGECWVVTPIDAKYGSCEDAFVLNGNLTSLLLYRSGLAYVKDKEGLERPTAEATALQGMLKGEQVRFGKYFLFSIK